MTYRINVDRSPIRRLVRLIRFGVLGVLLCCHVFSDTENIGRQYYSIPEGKAQKTLKMVAVQGEVDLVALRKITRGINTPPLEGHYGIEEAFGYLLENTPIKVIYRSEINAYTVVKRSSTPSVSNVRNKLTNTETTKEMIELRNLIKKMTRGAAAVGVIAGSGALNAQDASGDGDDIFELSPFTVDASDQDGYRANNTLAGTRIKTPLKDLGSAIQVVTEEFLEDTGVTGIDDLLLYTTSTEIGGPNGNFSGVDFATDAGSNGAITNDDASRINSRAGSRVRGIAKPNFTRNYFSSDIRVDSYNTGGITISRGANSLLFGLGSAAGVVNNSVKMPFIGQNSNKLTFRFGEHDSTRATFDFTRTIIEDRLAVKVSGLQKRTNFTQNPAFNDENRIYGAFNLTLFKNENVSWLGKTSIRGNIEFGDSEGTPPKSLTPNLGWESFFIPPPDFERFNDSPFFVTGTQQGFRDAWSKWRLVDTLEVADGSPGYREAQTLAGDYPVYSTPFFFNPPVATIQPGGVLTTGIPGRPEIAGFRTWANGNQRSSGIDADGNFNPDNQHFFRPAIFVNTRTYEEGQQGAGFRGPTLNNTDIFDYRNNLLTGDIDRVTTDFDAQTFFLEQTLFDGKAGFEIAVDHQDKTTFSFLPFGGSGRTAPIFIDTTLRLSNGELNPNAGKPFINSSGTQERERTRITERDNARVTAFYNLDFNDINDNLSFLGRHNFTGFIQTEEFRSKTLDTRAFITSPDIQLRGGNPLNTGQRRFSGIYYLTDQSLVNTEVGDVRLQPISRDNLLEDGDQYQILFYPYSGGANGTQFATANDPTNTISTGTLEYSRFLNGVGVGRDEVESKALAWQSYLFGGHIVGLFGLREDEVSDFGRVRVDPETGETLFRDNGSIDTRGVVRTGTTVDPNSIDARLKRTDPTGRTKTWSVVGHLPQKYLENSPISSLSAHYAVSENFQPGESGFDHNNEFIPAPQGETTEYGISLGLADDKWNLRLNRFESSQRFQTATSLNGAINNGRNRPISWANNWFDAKLANEAGDTDLNFARMVPDGNGGMQPNPTINVVEAIDAGFTSYDQVIEAILVQSLPQGIQDLFQYDLNDDNDQIVATGPGIDNLKAVRNLEASGYELEIVGNPTKNWRTSINFVQLESTPSDTGGPFGEFAGEVLAGLFENNIATINESPTGGIVDLSVRWRQVLQSVITEQSQDGRAISEQAKYRANAVVNYKATEGKFKGFSFGGAARYRSATQIGTGLILNDDGVAIPDPDNIFEGDSDVTFDSWVSYSRKIMEDRVNWKIQLNVRNLFGDEDDIAIYTNPAGVDRIFRVAPDVRSWFVTNSFSF